MKVSLRVGMRDGDPVNPLDGVLRDVKEMGYDAIELMMNTSHSFGGRHGIWASESITPEMRESFRQSSAKHGVEIATLSSDWAWGYASFNPKLSMWARGTEILKGDVNLAADLGAKAILIHVGTSQGSWEEIRSIVKQVVAVGEARKVKVAFEAGIFARIGLGGLDALIKLVDELDSPWFKVYEHCYWPRGTTQPHDEIKQVGNRMASLHSGNLNVQVDYEKMIKAIKDVNYDFVWVFEVGWDRAKENVDGYKYLWSKYGG